MTPFSILQIEPTDDSRAIKRARQLALIPFAVQ